MRSTRYLANNMSVDDVALIGRAAVINQTESKAQLVSDLNSVLSSKYQMKRMLRPDTMKDSNSQTDMAALIVTNDPSMQNAESQAM